MQEMVCLRILTCIHIHTCTCTYTCFPRSQALVIRETIFVVYYKCTSFFLQRSRAHRSASVLAPLFVLHDGWDWIIHGKSHSYIALSWSKRLTSLQRLECLSDYYASPTFMWKHLVTMMSVTQTIQRVFIVSPGYVTTICINLWALAA